MLTSTQIAILILNWLAIQQTLKWFFDDKKEKQEIVTTDEKELDIRMASLDDVLVDENIQRKRSYYE